MGGGGWLEKLGIRLSQRPAKLKLKLKLKLSLAIISRNFSIKSVRNIIKSCPYHRHPNLYILYSGNHTNSVYYLNLVKCNPMSGIESVYVLAMRV